MKKLSPLQTERLKYQPKLPSSLSEGINSLEMVEGNATQSVRDQEQIQELFKNTYGKPVVTFRHSGSSNVSSARSVRMESGVCLMSQGQPSFARRHFMTFKKRSKAAAVFDSSEIF